MTTTRLQQIEALLVRYWDGTEGMSFRGWTETVRALQAMTQFAVALGDPEIIDAMQMAFALAQERRDEALNEEYARHRAAMSSAAA